MVLVVTVVAAWVAAVVAAHQATVKVTLQQGAIVGSREEATNGRVYYSFKTIPYARPPVGPLRFKDPEPAPAWNGVRNGSLPFPRCPQASIFVLPSSPIEGQEDCLYLSVYTPTPDSSNLAVMVYIHAGAFMTGLAGEGASPAPLMQKDVVVVTINYRLGALGFLSTGDSVLPGNLGLKDQVLALRWVQDNIKDLGGDPQQVTIFGVGSGGISAHFHVLSPTSAGLFTRAILQSGTAFLVCRTCSKNGAISVSKALDCTAGEDSHQLLACFMNATVEGLVAAQASLGEWYHLPYSVGPRVDGTFLPDHPAALIKSGQYNEVDMIIGATQDDGNLLSAALFSEAGEEELRELNDDFNKVGPIVAEVTEDDNPVYLARRVFLHYMNDLNVTLDDELAVTSVSGDRALKVPSARSADFHAKNRHTKTFMYELQHHLQKSFMAIITNTSIQRPMAGHNDDLMYLFQLPPPLDPLHRPQDLHVREIFVTLWTNFAATGNPTINGTLGFRWTHVTPEEPLQYLAITTNPSMQLVDSRILNFWNSLPTETTKLLYPELFREDENSSTSSEPA